MFGRILYSKRGMLKSLDACARKMQKEIAF